MPSPRANRLADQIQVVVAQLLERRIKDPRLGFITVTDVSLTGDSRDATVYYTVLGDQSDLEGTAAALHSASGMLRGEVGRQLGLKFAPKLNFIPDSIPESARQVDHLLDQVKEDDARKAAAAQGKQYAGDQDPYTHGDSDQDDLES